jgi:hypothetical protein
MAIRVAMTHSTILRHCTECGLEEKHYIGCYRLGTHEPYLTSYQCVHCLHVTLTDEPVDKLKEKVA